MSKRVGMLWRGYTTKILIDNCWWSVAYPCRRRGSKLGAVRQYTRRSSRTRTNEAHVAFLLFFMLLMEMATQELSCERLPVELQDVVVLFIPPQHVPRALLVCKRWCCVLAKRWLVECDDLFWVFCDTTSQNYADNDRTSK